MTTRERLTREWLAETVRTRATTATELLRGIAGDPATAIQAATLGRLVGFSEGLDAAGDILRRTWPPLVSRNITAWVLTAGYGGMAVCVRWLLGYLEAVQGYDDARDEQAAAVFAAVAFVAWAVSMVRIYRRPDVEQLLTPLWRERLRSSSRCAPQEVGGGSSPATPRHLAGAEAHKESQP